MTGYDPKKGRYLPFAGSYSDLLHIVVGNLDAYRRGRSIGAELRRLCGTLTAGAEEREPSTATGVRADAGLAEFVFGSAFAGVDAEAHGIHWIVFVV